MQRLIWCDKRVVLQMGGPQAAGIDTSTQKDDGGDINTKYGRELAALAAKGLRSLKDYARFGWRGCTPSVLPIANGSIHWR
jgi:hypothetical protein